MSDKKKYLAKVFSNHGNICNYCIAVSTFSYLKYIAKNIWQTRLHQDGHDFLCTYLIYGTKVSVYLNNRCSWSAGQTKIEIKVL